jgi:hypothetical protein
LVDGITGELLDDRTVIGVQCLIQAYLEDLSVYVLRDFMLRIAPIPPKGQISFGQS